MILQVKPLYHESAVKWNNKVREETRRIAAGNKQAWPLCQGSALQSFDCGLDKQLVAWFLKAYTLILDI